MHGVGAGGIGGSARTRVRTCAGTSAWRLCTECRALLATLVHGRVREPVDGEAEHRRGTACRRERAGAMPAAGAAGQGERGEHRDERGAQRRREEDKCGYRHDAVEPSHERVVPAAAGSAASRRPSEARNER